MALIAVPAPVIVSSYNVPLENSFYSIPKEGQAVTFNCTTPTETRALFWILPNGTRIDVGQGSEDHLGQVLVAMNFNGSSSQLIIPEVRRGMDGQYVCVLDGAPRQIFFIPYVVSTINFAQAVMISLGVTVGFAVACASVLLFDRYCASGFHLRHHAAQVADESPLPPRKQRVMNNVLAEQGSDTVTENDAEQLAMQSHPSHN
uniref:Ig-like domain-containing protein n=1 Tax=Ascaris lumbricoides TaxID=6252 RepID=A0A0M3HSQ3_ASCLU